MDDMTFERGDEATLRHWHEQGFALIRRGVPAEICDRLLQDIDAEHARLLAADLPLADAGISSGHLNCYPGDASAELLDALERRGIVATMGRMLGGEAKLISIGCNLNLPGSHFQNWHIDTGLNDRFLVVNVALQEVDERNGSIQLAPGTTSTFIRYWQFCLRGLAKTAIRQPLSKGDVLIRSSVLWHRGTPNRTNRMRPMIALIYSFPDDPVADTVLGFNGGKVRFMANRFTPGLSGAVKEFIAVRMPAVHAGIRLIKSFVAPIGHAT